MLRSVQPRSSRWPISSAYDWPDHNRAPWNWPTALFGASQTTSPMATQCSETAGQDSNRTSTVHNNVQSFTSHYISVVTVEWRLSTSHNTCAFSWFISESTFFHICHQHSWNFPECCSWCQSQKASSECSQLLLVNLCTLRCQGWNCIRSGDNQVGGRHANCQHYILWFCKLHTDLSVGYGCTEQNQ